MAAETHRELGHRLLRAADGGDAPGGVGGTSERMKLHDVLARADAPFTPSTNWKCSGAAMAPSAARASASSTWPTS